MHGKYSVIRFQSDTSVFKSFRRNVDGAQEVEIALSTFWQYLKEKDGDVLVKEHIALWTEKLILHFEFLLITQHRDNMKTFTNRTIQRFLNFFFSPQASNSSNNRFVRQ